MEVGFMALPTKTPEESAAEVKARDQEALKLYGDFRQLFRACDELQEVETNFRYNIIRKLGILLDIINPDNPETKTPGDLRSEKHAAITSQILNKLTQPDEKFKGKLN